ncbi:RNA-directed DNA polymerase [Nodosilinea sp. LEGE 07088]|uniref:RNA-directed DNA polymerase n=1 Tax=Nodosilinea sp. LEGE 07088 TaxID=2777968 RepID=UPI0018830D50|nr:RNA-directed DNA polymerase [Nodosilinea sp. LEGE 07088]MBE9140829.1 RNA-directed DNA polymerase [Nodosilinea sp. LEGE 07088]
MKRHGNLWPSVIDFSNLLCAARKAQKGKRFRPNILDFNYHLEQELHTLKADLEQKTYKPGKYRTFEIKEPKPRLISAAPYRDRVVHHALCNVITPLMEPSFIYDTYANRERKGTHLALQRFTRYARSSDYVLQCDIQKYFPSIDHQILKACLRRKIKCPDTLWLIDTIIDGSNEQIPAAFHFQDDDLLSPLNRRRGLPIGNLTSQFFANVYLSGFDHFVKETLGGKKYLRYVDDFALFSDSHDFLTEARQAIEAHLDRLRLKIHPVKSHISKTQQGANFLGFRIFPDRIRVRTENLRRARRRCRELQISYAARKIDLNRVVTGLQSWEAHLKHGDTQQLRRHIFNSLVFSRG